MNFVPWKLIRLGGLQKEYLFEEIDKDFNLHPFGTK
jgi:hypothetical protein